MKKNRTWLLLAGLVLCAAMPLPAQERSADEKKLDSAAMKLDKAAAEPAGAKTVEDRLKSEFMVDDARVQSLRGQNLGYGEVSVVLSLAKELPGGITDANVQKVMALRQGPPVMGWGKVAKELGLKLGPAISKANRLSAEARKAEKGKMGGKEDREKDEKGGKMERMEKSERPEKMERMGTHERPSHSGPHGRD